MNIHQFEQKYSPRLFLTIYQLEQNKSENEFNEIENDQFYIESQLPISVNNQTIPGPASPLTEESVKSLASFFAKTHKADHAPLVFKNLISHQCLLANNNGDNYTIIWHCKPRKQLLLFGNQLQIPSDIVSIPNLIFKANKSSLSVWAILDEHPDHESILHHAPFFNIYDHGSICLGSMKTPEKPKYFEEAIHEWESQFFNSYFTHLNINESPTRSNIASLWINLIKTQKPFPNKELKPTLKRLKDILL